MGLRLKTFWVSNLQDLVTNIMDLSESDKRKQMGAPIIRQKAPSGAGTSLGRGVGFRV